jgi:endonuclease YncB( thermonuclease family)
MMSPRVALGVLVCCLAALAIAHPGGVDDHGCHKDTRTNERHCHPERAKGAQKTPAYDREHPPKPGDEGVFYGPTTGVVDGDTFRARVQGVVLKFRLGGIDAPEHDQPYGATSTALLRELTQGQQVVLVYDDVDAYGRIVVRAWVGKLDINAEMVERGAAWFESEYSSDDELYWLEEEANKQKRGLWALPAKDRVDPRVWREKMKRQAARGGKGLPSGSH